MALETASYISQLVVTNPTASDPKSQGDNQIRLVKTVLVNQLGSLGAAALTVTATQINNFIANGGIYSVGTSVTSLTVGAGSQTFVTQTGRGFAIGQSIKITSDYDVSTFMTGVCTAYDTTTGAMSVLVDDVSGSGTSALWSISVFIASVPADLIRSARTSNTILGTADKGTLIDITSGTFSQTFDAVATLGDGWWCILRNSGTGDITLDPNSTELIDGLASYVMYPGEERRIQCDGTALRSTVINAFYKTFTASGTFTKPPRYSALSGLLWSAGASGQRTNSAGTLSTGGGGGACLPFSVSSAAVGTTETVTIGAGGAAITGVATGDPGGNSSFGSLAVAYGQASGTGFRSGGSGIGAGVTAASTAAANFEGELSSATPKGSFYGGSAASSNATAASGNAVFGGAAGGSVDGSGNLRAAGASSFGGAGGAASIAGNGTDGTAPGGGGGATQTGTQSGAGARGELRIWGII